MIAFLRTRRLLLRQWRDEDLTAFARLSANAAVMEYLLPFEGPAATELFVLRIREHFEQYGFGYWVVEIPEVNGFIGIVGLARVTYEGRFTPAVEIGWRIDSAYWGQGFATEAATLAIDDGFRRLGLQEIVALTVPGNRRSRRVMERLGMKRSEKDDFDHPLVPNGHPLKRHVLYRLTRRDWQIRLKGHQ